MKWILVILTTLAILGGCTSNPKSSDNNHSNVVTALELASAPEDEARPESTPEAAPPKYSFKAKNILLREALTAFAKLYDINMYLTPGLNQRISVDFRHLPLDEALEVIIGAHGYGWEIDNSIIRIKKIISRTFEIDYMYLQRSGQISNSVGISTTQSGSSTGSSSISGSMTNLTQRSQIDFWQEIEKELKGMLSKTGRLQVNRLSGVVQVTDRYDRVRQMERFIKDVGRSVLRQVLIEARIVEVTLRDDRSFGINWENLSAEGITGAVTNLVTSPMGGNTAKSANMSLSSSQNNFDGILEALYEQGNVKVVSKPRVRVLNNQSSVIKVGTDRTFFTQTVTRVPSSNGTTDTIVTETPTTVTEGIVLTVTPQISSQRWVILDIAPIVTRVIDTVTSSQGSTAPVLDIKQASSVLRVKSNDLILLGGLIQEETSETVKRIPILGHIPLLGYLFSGVYTSKEKKELVIMLKARVIE